MPWTLDAEASIRGQCGFTAGEYIPPATICLWPYEEMYNRPEVKGPDGRYDNDLPLKFAKEYFAQ